MAMMKKDYVVIAATLNGARRQATADLEAETIRPDEHTLIRTTIDEIADHLADRFAEGSDTFNEHTFRTAVRKED